MKAEQIPLPSQESTNAFQVNTVLAVVHTLQPYLVSPRVEIGAQPPEVDGGVRDAATATFIKACDRLDQILDDKIRWSMANPNALYKAMVDTQRRQQEFLVAQTASAKVVQRPAFLWKPTVMVWEDGYLAFWGDPNDVRTCIAGKGPTPEAALEDFDAAFLRTPPEQVKLIQDKLDNPNPTQPE